MIDVLEINNFKSIKKLQLRPCKRINIFIGEPNTGKSNILESLGLLSYLAYGKKYNLHHFVRYELLSNLFFDDEIEKKIKIRLQHGTLSDIIEIFYTEDDKYEATYYSWDAKDIRTNDMKNIEQFITSNSKKLFTFDYNAHGSYRDEKYFRFIKFYRFDIKINLFPEKYSAYLFPPIGSNLISVLKSHKDLRQEVITNFLARFSYKLMLKPQENKIEIVKQYDDVMISIPFALISDTIKRLIFYLTAILSNKGSILVFEEPESHTFPYYTKFLAETIALDDRNNQFFISTHNPYFLFSVLEKSQKDDITIFVVYMENFETKARRLTQQEIEEAMNIGLDFFFNLDRFKKEEQE